MRGSNEFFGAGKETWKQLENITAKGYDNSCVFGDFLDLMLCAFQRPNREEQYLSIMEQYKNENYPTGKRPADYFAKALGQLMLEMKEHQRDVIGNIFEQMVSYGNNGQFLTPKDVGQLLAELTFSGNGKSTADHASGSGRLLVEAGKKNPHGHFFGKDIDVRCAKMTALNLLFFNLNGTVEHGDTLRDTTNAVWKTQRTVMGGIIYQLSEEEVEAYVDQKLKWMEETMTSRPRSQPKEKTTEPKIEKQVEATETQVTETLTPLEELPDGQKQEIELAHEFGIDPLRFEEQQQMVEENLSEYEDLPLFASLEKN